MFLWVKMVFLLNLDEIRDRVRDLIKYSDVRIQELPKDVGTSFKEFISVVEKIHKSDGYTEVFHLIDQETSHISEVTPGTVGSYFRGCLLSTGFPDDISCSDICIKAFQPPDTIDGWKCCQSTVINAHLDEVKETEYTTTKYHQFDLICKGGNPGYIILDYPGPFPGFSITERDKIVRMGLKKCKLLQMRGKEYVDILGGYYSVSELPIRPPCSQENLKGEIDSFFVFVGIILASIFVLFYLNREK